MKDPLISVIIPVYNAGIYLNETLDSVVKQTYSNLEIIIINDGSTDDSLDIIRKYIEKDKRIHLFSVKNCGQSAASNYGLSKANGKYIKFIDADDVLSKDHLKLQLNAIQDYPNHLASCEWGRFYDGNYLSANFKSEPVWQDLEPLDWIKASLAQKSDMMSAWLWLIPRVILQNAGNWNEKLSLNNDFDFSIRLLFSSEGVKFAKGAKLYYRSGILNSLSVSFSKLSVESAYLTTYLGCSKILQFENTEYTKRLCANRFQTWIFRIYPQFPDLIKKFKDSIEKLGGSDIKMDGGKIFIFIRNILGWKIAKRIQIISYKMGWILIVRLKYKWKTRS